MSKTQPGKPDKTPRGNRLFVFDVDGTILPSFKAPLSPNLIDAFNQLLAQGDAICIASGRPFKSIHSLLSELIPGKKFAGIANGSVLRDYDGNFLLKECLRLSDLDYFVEKYGDNPDLSLYAYTVDDPFLFYKESRFTEMERDVNLIEGIRIDESFPKDAPITKIMVAAETKELAETLSLTEEETLRYDTTRSGPLFFEILPKGVSKGSLTESLRKHLKIRKEDVYCFGDSINDLAMVSMFHGVALAGAVPEVKKAAEIVTLPCEEEGVYYALKNILGFVH